MKELLEFIGDQDRKLIAGNTGNLSPRERVLARTVKLGEEFGELCDEVLASQGDQRKEKLDAKDGSNDLEEEFADVLITTLLLARAMDVNVEQALEGKMAKIRKRVYGSGR